MKNSNSLQVSEVKSADEELRDLPKGLSFFDPIIRHEAKEALEAGGEVYVSQNSDGHKSGFLSSGRSETTGNIFSGSKGRIQHFSFVEAIRYHFSEYETAEHPQPSCNDF